MIKFIKRKIEDYIKDEISRSKTYVEHPELIGYNALVRNSIIHGNVKIGEHSKIIDANISGNVEIGRWSTFNGPNSDIYATINSVTIGNYCSIARNVSVQEYDHCTDRITSYFIHQNVFGEEYQNDITSKGEIIIENDVWVGTQSVILSGAHISNGAIIGANSVVNSFIPPYAYAVGSPAKVVKFRFDDVMIKKLLSLQWWYWSEEKIKANRTLFDKPLTEDTFDRITH